MRSASNPLRRLRKAKRKNHPGALVVIKGDRALMCLHDFHCDGESQSSTRRTAAVTTPESFENMLPVLWRNPGPMVSDAHVSACVCGYHDFAARRRVSNRILDKISDCIPDSEAIAFHHHRYVIGTQRDRALP